MKSLTALDIYFVKQELDALTNAKVDKIYQPDEDTLILQLHKDGKRLIKILLPGFIFMSKTKSVGEQLKFATFLRKHLTNYRLIDIQQKKFERILEFEFALNDKKILIIELFSKGNVILCDDSYKILSALKFQAWKDRTIRPNEQYKYPPAATNPFNLGINELTSTINKSEKDSIVKILAIELSFGGVYAEEICLLAEIDKSKKILNTQEIKALHKVIQQLKKEKIKANISENGAFPFALASFKEGKLFDTFSEAIEEYLENMPKETGISKEQERLTKLLEIQKNQLENIKISAEEEKEKANLIYNNYQKINALLQLKDLDKIQDNPKVKSIDKKEKTFTIEIENADITLNINKSIDQNAAVYYEKAKHQKNKMPGAEAAIKKTIERLKKAEVKEVKTEKTIERKREWYEKFRWFISSEGFLVIGGRDATTNDIIVKKHLDKNDLVFHTELRGSPFAVIKAENKNIGQKTIDEAAIFCASNSKQWDAKLAMSDVYCIKPDQVKKELGLPKGTFMIYGKRTYLKPVLKLAIGIADDGKVICAPIDAVKANCKNMILINQGDVKKSDIAKKIKKRFESELKIKINLDEIMQVLPPGNCAIQ